MYTLRFICRSAVALQIALILFLSLASPRAKAEYAIPPGRSLSWYPAGLDVIGGIPSDAWTTVPITGLHPDGTVDDSGRINAAITAASANTVLTIPAGSYLIQHDIRMKSNVVLRGAKQSGPPYLPAVDNTATTLILDGCEIFFRGGDKTTNWWPGPQSGLSITAGYTQGSTSLTLANNGTLAVGDYVCVYQNKDTVAIDDKGLDYLGEDSGPDPHVWAQYTKITGIAGNVITIEPPLYQVTPNPTGQSVRKQRFGITRAGIENMRLNGNNGSNNRILNFRFCSFCWVKGVETYYVGADSSGSPHIWTEFCYANEYRRNYLHHGAGHDSGENYGIEFYHWNSRHKVEDNIVRETRHSIVFEGGGSGCVILYNYTDDNWESVEGQPNTRDDEFLSEDQVGNHGAHPYMNLWEGNWGSCWWGDYTQGSSSYLTVLRNAFSGKQTSYSLDDPWSWTVIEVEKYNRYFNLIGNIVGNITMTGGTVIDNGNEGPLPTMFRFGYSSAGGSYADSLPYSTVILHGNYDFVSDSVHDWASPDHVLPMSLYYTTRPAFFGNLTWPPYNPTTPTNNGRERIPAGYRFVNGTDPPTPPPKSDFNRDGKPDYLLYNPGTRQTAVWYLNNNLFIGGAFAPTLPVGWRVIDVEDFNRDGRPDYALFNASTRRTAIWYLSGVNGVTFIGSAWGPILPSGWTLVATGEFNNDLKPDFVIFNASTRQTAIWYLNNNMFIGGAFGPSIPAPWSLVGIADFNRDGKRDYLLFNPNTHTSVIWYLSGAVRIGSAFGPTIAAGYNLIGTSDFNRDGKPDYLLFKPSTRQTAIWYLNNNVRIGTAVGPTLAAGFTLAAP